MYQLSKYPYSHSSYALEFYLRVCFPCAYLQMPNVRHLKRSYFINIAMQSGNPKTQMFMLVGLNQNNFFFCDIFQQERKI